jgi:hypothetical protein
MNDIREQLAELAHQQWSDWMRYFLGKCERADGSFAIPYDYHRNLKRQIDAAYADLSEHEKNADREEADKVLAIIGVMDGE